MHTQTSTSRVLLLLIALASLSGCSSGGGSTDSSVSADSSGTETLSSDQSSTDSGSSDNSGSVSDGSDNDVAGDSGASNAVPGANTPVNNAGVRPTQIANDTPGITPANIAPSISGDLPSEVIANARWTFIPVAMDPDGDELSFSVENLPEWAVFNESSGELSGEPSEADVGLYENIIVSTSDGTESTSLGPFSLEVLAAGSGTASVTLTWTAPTRNEDGSELNDLAGFTIYYGLQSGSYSEHVEINNPSITSYVVEGLAPGRYYFVATATNAQGEESRYSGEAIKEAGE